MQKEITIKEEDVMELVKQLHNELGSALEKKEESSKSKEESSSSESSSASPVDKAEMSSVSMKKDEYSPMAKDESSPEGSSKSKEESSSSSSSSGSKEDAPVDTAPMAAANDPKDDSAMEPSPSGADAMAPTAAAHEETPGEIHPAASHEALQAEYAKLSDEELHMHLAAAHAAAAARFGSDGMDDGQSDAAAPAPDMGSAPAAPDMAMKAEMKQEGSKERAIGGQMAAMKSEGEAKVGETLKKSESELKLEALEKKFQDQSKAFEALLGYVTAPVRKSIKNLSELKFLDRNDGEAAAEVKKTYTKQEIAQTLRDKAKTLSKSDRDLVTGYYEGRIEFGKIEHLLNEKVK